MLAIRYNSIHKHVVRPEHTLSVLPVIWSSHGVHGREWRSIEALYCTNNAIFVRVGICEHLLVVNMLFCSQWDHLQSHCTPSQPYKRPYYRITHTHTHTHTHTNEQIKNELQRVDDQASTEAADTQSKDKNKAKMCKYPFFSLKYFVLAL